MAAPQPKTIAAEIEKQIADAIFSGGQMLDPSGPVWTALWDQLEKLQAVDVVRASFLKADLFQWAGDIERVEYWVNNARKNGEKLNADLHVSAAYSNLGYVTRASEIYQRVMSVMGDHIPGYLVNGISSANFEAIVGAAEMFSKAGGDIGRKDVVERATAARGVLRELNLGEDALRRIMDEAGTIMRNRRLIWANQEPDLHTSIDDGESWLSLSYRVSVNPAAAAQMTWELAERLAALDLMAPNVTVSFVGQAEQ
jgi:hypothetical protein